jgi:diacylglycerol kinase (ATP)
MGLTVPEVAPRTAVQHEFRGGGRRLVVLVNPVAGGGRKRYLAAVLAALEADGIEVTVRQTEFAGNAWRQAATISASQADVIVAAGGDGTINEVVNGLAENPEPPVLGVIPLGTANIFARNLRLPRLPRRLARVIASPHAGPFRPGTVNGRRFVAMAGIGFDARVVAGVDTRLKHRIGKGAYVWQSLVELSRAHSREFDVRFGSETIRAAGVVALRGPHYGGGFVMSPDARVGGSQLDLCCLSRGDALDIVRQGLALGLGCFQQLSDLTYRQFPRAHVEGPEDEPIQADGDLVGYLPARLGMAASPIQVIGLRSDL